ncbi:hypothetical protein B0H63DRAFT_455428 [Podospora didyma]|uniref:Stc1 domain-containing protein n=1 Tax=Podospora didyma TaxID=330526 RepID=A0AAE0K222_9PEZI|nr:hypothetical protein B0H63DRAFT_455428 [Podospora didyma]
MARPARGGGRATPAAAATDSITAATASYSLRSSAPSSAVRKCEWCSKSLSIAQFNTALSRSQGVGPKVCHGCITGTLKHTRRAHKTTVRAERKQQQENKINPKSNSKDVKSSALSQDKKSNTREEEVEHSSTGKSAKKTVSGYDFPHDTTPDKESGLGPANLTKGGETAPRPSLMDRIPEQDRNPSAEEGENAYAFVDRWMDAVEAAKPELGSEWEPGLEPDLE